MNRSVALLCMSIALPAAAQEAPTPREAEAIAEARQLAQAFSSVADRVSPSVVSVRVEAELPEGQMIIPFGPFGMAPPAQGEENIAFGNGSGVIVRADGYILTNNHVVSRARRIDVGLQDGRRFSGRIVGTDPATDLAVIRIDARELPAASFAQTVRAGQWAIAIGSPFGLDYTVTTGVVSSVGRGGLGITEIEDYVQTDASINPGNSGGPLVDLDGRVIGINTMIVGRGAGIGFAVSAELAQRVTDQILRYGRVRRPWIGVQFQELTPELASAFSLGDRSHAGALIADVVPRGPAARAGLAAGDVVVGVDGERIAASSDLLRAVLRRDIALRTRERPRGEGEEEPAPRQRPGNGRPPAEGITLAPLNLEQQRVVGSNGVLVTEVARGSDADRAGLRHGDVILEADGDRVSEPRQVIAALGDRRALLRARRGEGAFYTVVVD
jgi:serine protease Do